MTLLFIQLAQTVTGAVLTIIALLLDAVIIGYFSAWFYAKSVYLPVIRGLEADKTALNNQFTGLNNQITGLKDDIGKQTATIEVLNAKISKLEEESAGKDKEITRLTLAEKKQKMDI